MTEAVIFDMDGVIFDSEALVMKTWKIVAEKYGFGDIESVCRQCLGTNAAATRQIFLDAYGEEFPYDDYKKEMSGVREILKYLKNAEIKTGLATSTREAVVRKELEEAGIIEFFDVIVCGDMVERSKPAPDIYLEACRRLQVRPEDSCAVEDSYNGIRAAYAAGMKPVMVPDLAEPTEEMENLAECILPSLHEVREYLAGQR